MPFVAALAGTIPDTRAARRTIPGRYMSKAPSLAERFKADVIRNLL